MLLDSVGVKDESYVIGEDGDYAPGPEIISMTESGKFPSMTDALTATYTLGSQALGLYNWAYGEVFSPSSTAQATAIWDDTENRLLLPAKMTMTDEESAAFYALYTDLKTLVDINVVKFIVGSQPMEAYDAFLDQIRTFGIEECLKYQQAALDRYNQR